MRVGRPLGKWVGMVSHCWRAGSSRSARQARCLYYENLVLKKKASQQGQRRIAALPASGPWLE